MKTLKELYNLSYEDSVLQTSLILWFNQLIDKTYEELDATDVSKMYRQKLLINLAMKKAIELFFINPFDGEFFEGELLGLINTFDLTMFTYEQLLSLEKKIKSIDLDKINIDWITEDEMMSYKSNMEELEKKITGIIKE
jgi:hypothetical protein